MTNYSDSINSISQGFDEKKNKKLASDLFSRLCTKLKDEENFEIDGLIKNTYEINCVGYEKFLMRKRITKDWSSASFNTIFSSSR